MGVLNGGGLDECCNSSQKSEQIINTITTRKHAIAKLQAERDAKMKTVKNAKTFCQ